MGCAASKAGALDHDQALREVRALRLASQPNGTFLIICDL